MSENNERKGVLPQIIVAVVVALLVGGTSPWWWNEIFPKKNAVIAPPPNPPTKVTPPVPVHGGQIQVRCTAMPHSIPAGGQAEIRVLAFTEESTPVSGANVRIESGGGWFSTSGTTTEVGQTDFGGVFITRWRSPSPAARGYGMGITVTKSGSIEGRGECNVSIE